MQHDIGCNPGCFGKCKPPFYNGEAILAKMTLLLKNVYTNYWHYVKGNVYYCLVPGYII